MLHLRLGRALIHYRRVPLLQYVFFVAGGNGVRNSVMVVLLGVPGGLVKLVMSCLHQGVHRLEVVGGH